MADLSLFVSLLLKISVIYVTYYNFRKFTVVDFGVIFLLVCGHSVLPIWLSCVAILLLKT